MKYVLDFDNFIKENNETIDKVLHIYDVDGTLLDADSDVIAFDKRTHQTVRIPHQEWLDFVKNDGDNYVYNFSEFDTLDCLLNAKKLPGWDDFIAQYNWDNDSVGIMSARGNKRSIVDFLALSGVDNIKQDLIYAVADPSDKFYIEPTNPLRKRLAFEDLYKKGYRHIDYYDDMEDNLLEVQKLQDKYQDLRIDIKLI